MTHTERRDAMRINFLAAIREHSEDWNATTWDHGIETRIRASGEPRWLVLADASDGWPIGYEAEDGWDPLTAGERSRLADAQEEA